MKNDWKNDFDKQFGEIEVECESFNSYNGVGYKDITKDIQDFIESLLAEQKKELIEEILKMGEIHMNDGMWVYHGKIQKLLESLKHHD